MASYRDRILKAIQESENGLTTVDVAKEAGVSKTTVIKYLSVLRSEGLCQFVEVGPSKLWRATTPNAKVNDDDAVPWNGEEEVPPEESSQMESLSLSFPGEKDSCDNATVSLSFRVRSGHIISLIKQIKKYSEDDPR